MVIFNSYFDITRGFAPHLLTIPCHRGDAGPARTALRTPATEAFAAGLVPRPAA